VLPGERFIGAMRLGFQYVRESQGMKNAMVRIGSFFFHSTAVFALLPLIAKGFGSNGARNYTLLLASMGLGAVIMATQLPRLRTRFTRDQVAGTGAVVTGLAIAGVALSAYVWLAAASMFVAGAMWILVANSVTIAAQLSLPDWIRARGMSIYQMAIMGTTALGAYVWGKLASLTSVPTSLALAGVSMVIASLFIRHGRTLELIGDLTPTHPFDEPVPQIPIELKDGPIMVTIEYLVDPARRSEFEAIMAESRSARMRAGAVSWGLFEDVERPARYVEYFACDTWADYLRRFDRFTAADEELHQRRHAFHIAESPPRISRFVAR
jgi:MFS family permease